VTAVLSGYFKWCL